MIRCALIIALALFAAACTAAPKTDLQAGDRPSADSVEGGLWMVMERAETQLKTSGKVIPDPELQAYVNDVTCRLAGDFCGQIRTYVVRQPGFNASMAPNGFMIVWSGLLLRAENEAQLATVLGHEIAHYVRRHSLQRWETARDSLGAAMVANLVTAAAGVPVGGLIQLGVIGHIQSYSRYQEREADAMGFELMIAGGHDPHAAPKIWRNLIEEKEAGDEEQPGLFFSSHPPSEERMQALEAKASAASLELNSGKRGPVTSQFHSIRAGHLADWLEDEVDLGRYKQVLVLLERLMARDEAKGVVWYYQGEVLRRQPDLEDRSAAIAAYEKALQYDDAPTVTYRSLGILLTKQEAFRDAETAFRNYLKASPEAEDRRIIEYYLEELENKS